MQRPLLFRLILGAFCFTALARLSAQAPAPTVKLLATFDFPNALDTYAAGINDAGDIVGSFGVRFYSYGFERFANGTFKSIIDQPRDHNIMCSGINDSGIVCGASISAFFFDGSTFTYSSASDLITGINNAGNFVGWKFEANDTISGVASIGGEVVTLDIPGAISTAPQGINNLNEIVGWYTDSKGTHGFYRDAAGNLTYPIKQKNATYLALHGINDSGQMVGEWEGQSGSHCLVMRLPDRITSFQLPDAYLNIACGINNSGQISGTFFTATTPGAHGFIVQLRH